MVFRSVSDDVYETTRHAQLPELSLSIIGRFYLRGRVEPRPVVDPVASAKPAEPAVASLSPTAAKPAPQVLTDLPRQLQTELQRVGCKTGELSDDWDASARRALSSFNDNAGTKFDIKLASVDALDAVRARQERVCPLECE